MAKIRMLCAFSGKLCKECPVYRGRHYYLCFCDEYRGHLDELDKAGGTVAPLDSGLTAARKFEVPFIEPGSAIDPFVTIDERGEGGSI